MNAIVLYDCLADVADDLCRAITRLDTLTDAERGALEALWVRLDDLVEQLPPALKEAVQEAQSVAQDEIHELGAGHRTAFEAAETGAGSQVDHRSIGAGQRESLESGQGGWMNNPPALAQPSYED